MSEDSIAAEVFQRLQQATAKNPTELVELFREYLIEARQTLAQLQQAVAAKDAGAVRERAHFLKGASQVIGATAIAQGCATLEQMGRTADLTAVEQALGQTQVALKAAETEIGKKLGLAAIPSPDEEI